MTEFHKENMRKHIAFLRDNAEEIRKHFDMALLQNPEFIGCGTSACSLGWACVSVGIKLYSEENTEFIFFGIDGSDMHSNSIWRYCFDYSWHFVDNTPEAAAARLEAVLYNQVPVNWDFTLEFAHPIVIIPSELEQANKLKAELTHTLK